MSHEALLSPPLTYTGPRGLKTDPFVRRESSPERWETLREPDRTHERQTEVQSNDA